MAGNSCANLHKDDVNRCELISILSNSAKSIYLVTHCACLERIPQLVALLASLQLEHISIAQLIRFTTVYSLQPALASSRCTPHSTLPSGESTDPANLPQFNISENMQM